MVVALWRTKLEWREQDPSAQIFFLGDDTFLLGGAGFYQEEEKYKYHRLLSTASRPPEPKATGLTLPQTGGTTLVFVFFGLSEKRMIMIDYEGAIPMTDVQQKDRTNGIGS